MNKKYLGDSVYAETNGYHLMLTTSNGVETNNRILLEPSVVLSLIEYVNEVMLC